MNESQDFVSVLKDLSLIGIRDEEIAEKFMVKVSTVRKWESGKRIPGPFIRQEIRKLLDEMSNEVVLGDCYHTGLAYSLAYDAGGRIELSGKIFTNLDVDFDGGAMNALQDHRKKFVSGRDVPHFIVALKPVKIIMGKKEDRPYRLPYSDPYGNAGCDCCGTDDRIPGEKLCQDCLKEDTCYSCGRTLDDCLCEFCDNCDETLGDCLCERCGSCDTIIDPEKLCPNCGCDDDCRENISLEDHEVVTPPLNAFYRARHLKIQGKL